MSVTAVQRDVETLTLTITAAFAASVERTWELWADPRQLERWWGPPTYPATVVDHDLGPGGVVRYFMTGPEGERHHGWWRVTEAEPPHRLVFEDGFGDGPDQGAEGLPTMVVTVTLTGSTGGATTMTIASRFASQEAMEQILAMGAEEGMTLALGQIDAILTGDPA